MSKFILDRKKSVLIIVDIQERLVPAMKKRDKVYANCQHLIEVAKLLDIPIVITEQYSKGLGPTVNEIKDALPSYEPLEKVTFDCCRGEGFLEKIYTVHLVGDAVCSRKKDDYLSGREMMRDAGAVINCTETVLFQLLEKAGTPEFKAISKRIK
jgi:isochorismate hydrolase